MQRTSVAVITALIVFCSTPALAQPPAGHEQHVHADEGAGWHFMHDGAVFALFNHQGGPRGGDELKAPNWWMGMWSRKVGASELTVNTMVSLDPLTSGKRGYRELFQAGEVVDGRVLVDRQHPHDLFMQLAAIWRTPITDRTGVTIAGGPAAEPALGPVAFMHRASATEYPFATLSHHSFDSSHIAYGAVTAAVDHGPWMVEASLFNGREPDENRWDFDFGRLDSVSGRVWLRPTDRWELQFSTGHLIDPEELEPGTVQRTTTSASYFTRGDAGFAAATLGYAVNREHGVNRHAFFAEGTRRVRLTSIFGRLEILQLETDLFLDEHDHGGLSLPRICPSAVHCVESAARRDVVAAVTLGGVRDVVNWNGFEGGLGAALTLNGVPRALQGTHGKHPVSFQLYFRVRPPAGEMGRMWNMRMSRPH